MADDERHSGYTLVELLVVIGIIGLIAAIAAPATSRMIAAAEFRAEARAVETIARKCQSEALAKQRTLVISTAAELNSTCGGVLEKKITLTFDNPIRWFADGTTTGGRLTIQRGDIKRTVNVAWLTGTITSE